MSGKEPPGSDTPGPEATAGEQAPRSAQTTEGYLTGQFLIAMPTIFEGLFERSVIYIWQHNAERALGLIINKAIDEISLEELFQELGSEPPPAPKEPIPVIIGGPVDQARGFVLHTPEYNEADTIQVTPEISLTTSLDIVRAVGAGDGPRRWLIALGYAGWSQGQLEAELQANSWLTCPADSDIIFSENVEKKWEDAIHKLGIEASQLTHISGHA